MDPSSGLTLFGRVIKETDSDYLGQKSDTHWPRQAFSNAASDSHSGCHLRTPAQLLLARQTQTLSANAQVVPQPMVFKQLAVDDSDDSSNESTPRHKRMKTTSTSGPTPAPPMPSLAFHSLPRLESLSVYTSSTASLPGPVSSSEMAAIPRVGSVNSNTVLARGRELVREASTNLPCPRCESTNTKFCYFNNYNVKQPRHYCRACQRYWTAGGLLRSVPVGAGKRKSKAEQQQQQQTDDLQEQEHSTEQCLVRCPSPRVWKNSRAAKIEADAEQNGGIGNKPGNGTLLGVPVPVTPSQSLSGTPTVASTAAATVAAVSTTPACAPDSSGRLSMCVPDGVEVPVKIMPAILPSPDAAKPKASSSPSTPPLRPSPRVILPASRPAVPDVVLTSSAKVVGSSSSAFVPPPCERLAAAMAGCERITVPAVAVLASPSSAANDGSSLPTVDQQEGAAVPEQDAAALALMVQQQQAAWAQWYTVMASMSPHITAAVQAQLMLQMQAQAQAQAQVQVQPAPSLPLGNGLAHLQGSPAVDMASLAAAFPTMWPNPFSAPGLISAINSRTLPGLPPWPSCITSATLGSSLPSSSNVQQ